MSDSENAGRRSTPRVSLLGLLLITALVGTSISTWMLWREVGPLRAEVQRYRNELGVLTIDDPSRVHAIRVQSDDSTTWKWRLSIPDGAAYFFACESGEVGGRGVPRPAGTGPLGPGEYVLAYSVRLSDASGEREQRYTVRQVDSGSSGLRIEGGGRARWAEVESAVASAIGVGYETRSFASDEPVVVCRHRVGEGTISDAADDLKPGFLIWLTPAP